MAGDQHLLGRLLSVSGGVHPTMWLTEVDGELTDVVLALDSVVDCHLVDDPAVTMRFERPPIPSTLDSMTSPGVRKR